jgi:hypothetical protein
MPAAGLRLHRYEVATGTDQALWTSTVFFIEWRWDAAGMRGAKDASAFDPLAATAASTGIWFSDYRDANSIWHWHQGTGLRKVMVTGLPAVSPGSFPGPIPSSPCF